MTASLPWREIPGGVELAVRLTPRGGRAGFDGIGALDGQPFLRLRVASPPVDGAANAALIAFLAKSLDLPRSSVTLVAGDRARVKRLRLTGPDLAARLSALVAGT
ncbi:MAG: DUF167 family protein [Amaricoccus sp.]|uniref:DUF167 domain-containing protein n=1 Tax=Amaricoccus sp. TaxID=1872485 RepID=UPI0033152508